MRLNRLDLLRYGRFQDAHITFPKPAPGDPDVTIVYGSNEAGKSTAFTGYLELLFGLKKTQHPYAFRFERKDLLVGAELEIPGIGPMTFRRNGKASGSLVDAQNRPLDESILTQALHGINRDAYLERFSLNDEGLRKGGERIAGAQGDLGQLLHAGVSGLTTIAAVLDQMSALADTFHKKSSKSSTLAVAKKRLKDIEAKLKAERLTPAKAGALEEACSVAQKKFDEAEKALESARKRQSAGHAAQIWTEQEAKIAQCEAALKTYPSGPSLAKGTAEHVAALVQDLKNSSERYAEAETRIAQLKADIEAIIPDPSADAIRSELLLIDQHLIDGASLVARAATAAEDLPRRTSQLSEVTAQISKLCEHLELADNLSLDRSQLDELETALRNFTEKSQTLKASQLALKAALEQQREAPDKPQDLTMLKACYDRWQAISDLSAERYRTENSRSVLAKAIAALPSHWETLIDAGLPAVETLSNLAQQHTKLTAEQRSAQKELDAQTATSAEAKARRKSLEQTAETINIETVEEAKRVRDANWTSHLQNLDLESAQVFEKSMFYHDFALKNYERGAEARHRAESSRQDEAVATSREDSARSRLEILNLKCAEVTKVADELAKSLGLPNGTAPDGFAGRLNALVYAANCRAEARIASKEFEARNTQQQRLYQELEAAAREVHICELDDALPAAVQKALTLSETIVQNWKVWTEQERAIKEARDTVQNNSNSADNALMDLTQIAEHLGLQEKTPDALSGTLPELRKLQELRAKETEIDTRVSALGNAVLQLEHYAKRLELIMKEGRGASAMDTIGLARVRLKRAEENASNHRKLSERLTEEAVIYERASKRIAEIQIALLDCFTSQSPSSLATTERLAELLERDALRSEKDSARRIQKEISQGIDIELFKEECDLLPNAVRKAELDQILDDAQLTRDSLRDALQEARKVQTQAFGEAEQSELVTERATLLEVLSTEAKNTAIAKLGVLAARGALKELAAERRGTMLNDVEEAFISMTQPEWQSVDVWSEREGDRLVGVKPDGSSVSVQDMSTGTMGQLYFALRLAGYRSFGNQRGPLPMVLDDIMETFDDMRARTALSHCAKIGQTGQAILFTHHAHLLDLARSAIPSVSIVNMPGRG